MTHPALDVHAWDEAVPDSGILVTDGYHVTIVVRDGHLVITDGTPSQKRVRRLSRVRHGVTRVTNLGHVGYVTFEAQRWMRETGITFTSMHEPDRYQDWRAMTGQVYGSFECVRYLISRKIRGQAENLWLLDCAEEAQQVEDKLKHIENASDLDIAETSAAKIYWRAWAKTVTVPWKPSDVAKIPQHWVSFEKRRWGSTNANASDPVNAMLNYAYRIGENACRNACITVGLNPVLGISHDTRDGRQAFVLDMLEAVRPVADEKIIWYLMRLRGFDRRWLHETGNGVVVLDPPLTHRIAGWEAKLYDSALPVAVECARILRREHERRNR